MKKSTTNHRAQKELENLSKKIDEGVISWNDAFDEMLKISRKNDKKENIDIKNTCTDG
jgi:hypothetical protein